MRGLLVSALVFKIRTDLSVAEPGISGDSVWATNDSVVVKHDKPSLRLLRTLISSEHSI